uniref:Uncharacterized protein n=1 Tax=Bursaphelenchus xylophilus TaxID=6326 RepID=A0A1I7SJ33_BURXY
MCLERLLKSMSWSRVDKKKPIRYPGRRRLPLTENEEIPTEDEQLVESPANHITVLHKGDEKRIPISYAEEDSRRGARKDAALRKVVFRITSLSLQLSSHQHEEGKLRQRWVRAPNLSDEEKVTF